jgi:hypothetical protein
MCSLRYKSLVQAVLRILKKHLAFQGIRMVHLVYQLAMDWMTEGSEFEPWQGQVYSLLHVVQTGCGAHPGFCPMCIRGSIPGGKAAGV